MIPRACILCLLLLMPASVAAQQDTRAEIRDSQLRLERIRQEKLQLQEELETLRTRVRDARREAENMKRQKDASAGALRELDYQAQVIAQDVENTSRELGITHNRLRDRTSMLHERLRSIYKQGPLHTVRVLLAAQNFGDLLHRYKYLHLITLNDRRIVADVARLEARLAAQEQDLRQSLTQLESLRDQKLEELRQIEALEGRQLRTVHQLGERERVTAARIAQLAKDEAAVASLITELERRRLAGRDTRAGAINTRDLGALDWPVEGDLVFRFGPERKPNGVVLRYNGIGIAADAGTPVKAVEAGAVEIAGPLEGYGPSVVISHGAGYYTLYLRLRDTAVQVGDEVAAGQVIGSVGGAATPEGPHLEFQVRTPSPTTGSPVPTDPLSWLRGRAGQ